MKHATRIIAVLLLLVFGLGTLGYAMSFGKMEMSGQTMMSGMKSGAPDDCNKNAGDMAMSACTTMCFSVPDFASLASVSIEFRSAVFHGALTDIMSGSTAAPDPFPPKHII